ncbi:MAG: MFS transporter, partial [Alphaproteobacteria bacterium]
MTIVDPGTDETGGAAPRPLAVIVAMCAAHIASMTGFAAFPSLLPALQPLWALSNTEAGWINGIFFAGYVSAVPVMVSMTDRVDARSIYLLGLAISAAGLAGFALAAHGFWSALLWHAVAGIGVGSTYMTGLKVMTDRLAKPAPSRAVAVYAAMFSTGAALSFALNGAIGGRFGWQAAFAVSAAGPVLAFVLALAMLRPRPPAAAERPQTALLDFRPVLKNRTALGYMLGYAGHSWELFALRGWLVAFLVYAGIGGPAGEGSGAGEAAAIAAAASRAVDDPRQRTGAAIRPPPGYPVDDDRFAADLLFGRFRRRPARRAADRARLRLLGGDHGRFGFADRRHGGRGRRRLW